MTTDTAIYKPNDLHTQLFCKSIGSQGLRLDESQIGFGRRMQAARKRAGLSQEEAARRLSALAERRGLRSDLYKFHKQTLSDYERGATKKVPADILELLAEIYDLPYAHWPTEWPPRTSDVGRVAEEQVGRSADDALPVGDAERRRQRVRRAIGAILHELPVATDQELVGLKRELTATFLSAIGIAVSHPEAAHRVASDLAALTMGTHAPPRDVADDPTDSSQRSGKASK